MSSRLPAGNRVLAEHLDVADVHSAFEEVGAGGVNVCHDEL
ncbi:MAG: hypothetical protein WKF47_05445 [Geodermatophilaceae bacterium]